MAEVGMAEPKDAEFRVAITLTMNSQIEALLLANGIKNRAAWFEKVAQAEIDREVHKATVLLRMCGINPMLSDTSRKPPSGEGD